MDPVPPIASGAIHLWLAFSDDIGDERLHGAYRDLLSPMERQQERRFHFLRDRRRYLITRTLVRTVLSRYAPIAPRDWSFFTNPHGRPEISNAAAKELQLSFNVSHTHGLIALAVAVRALGVDVENTRNRQASLEIAERFFAPAEVAALATVPRSRQQDRFFEYWTLKEAYIKARGMGLSLPLDKFSFHDLNDTSVCLSIRPELADDPARWSFWQFRLAPDYLVALCVERFSSERGELVVRKTVPMSGSETTVVPEFLRTSRAQIDRSW